MGGILAPGSGEEKAQEKSGKKIFMWHGFSILFQGLFDRFVTTLPFDRLRASEHCCNVLIRSC
jgi:hypothetical protein